MGVQRVTTPPEVDSLAALLLAPDRGRPVVLVSTQPGAAAPLIDADRLADGCGDLAQVVVIPTGDLTFRLAALLPSRCAVWGGAGRTYPPGTDWTTDPYLSPLRFAYGQEDAPRAGDRLLEDALTMAAATGTGRRPRSATARRVEGLVQGVVAGGSRAFVRTAGGSTETLSGELTFPGIPLDWYLTAGLRITGTADSEHAPVRIDSVAQTPRKLLEHFGHGAVTLALVASTGRQEATLLLHPAVAVPVRRADLTSNPRDLVDHLLGEGEVVAVRVVRDPQGRLRLRLDDLEDDEQPLPAVSLVEGGAPWLIEGRDLVTARLDDEVGDEPAESSSPAELVPAAAEPQPSGPRATPSRPTPGPGRRSSARTAAPAPSPAGTGGKSLQQALLKIETLQSSLRRSAMELEAAQAQAAKSVAHPADTSLTLELGELRFKVADLQSRLRDSQRDAADLRKRARASGGSRRSPLEDRDRFDVDEEWIAHEVRLTWIERLGPLERRERPIDAGWSAGPRFAASLEGLTDSQLRKVFRTIVDVVVGLDSELDGRDLHQLRSGEGGDDPAETRAADGATCWRVAIERNTPSARRLHYWRRRDYWRRRAGVELSRVVLHDDFRA